MDSLLPYIQAHPWLVAATAVVLVAALAFEFRTRTLQMSSVTSQEAIRLMNGGAPLLDLRTAEAFREAHIVGARSMPAEQFAKAGDTMKKWKEKPLLVYCDSGSQSSSAIRQLRAQGFTKVFNLRGGLTAWRGESLPVEKS